MKKQSSTSINDAQGLLPAVNAMGEPLFQPPDAKSQEPQMRGCFLKGELEHPEDLPADLDLHKGPDDVQDFDSVLGEDADVEFTGKKSPEGLVGDIIIRSVKIGERKLKLNPAPSMVVKSARKIVGKQMDDDNKKLARPLSMLVKHIIRMCVHKIITVLYYTHRKVINKYQQEDLRTQLIQEELRIAGITQADDPSVEKSSSRSSAGPAKRGQPDASASGTGYKSKKFGGSGGKDTPKVSKYAVPEKATPVRDCRTFDEFPVEVQQAVKKWKEDVKYYTLPTRDQYSVIKKLKMELSQNNRQIVNKQMNTVASEELTKDEMVDLRLGLILDLKLKIEEKKRQKIEQKMKKAKKEEKKRRKKEKEKEKEKAKKNVLESSSSSSENDSDSDMSVKKPKALQQQLPKAGILDLVPEGKVDSEATRELRKEISTKTLQEEQFASEGQSLDNKNVKQEMLTEEQESNADVEPGGLTEDLDLQEETLKSDSLTEERYLKEEKIRPETLTQEQDLKEEKVKPEPLTEEPDFKEEKIKAESSSEEPDLKEKFIPEGLAEGVSLDEEHVRLETKTEWIPEEDFGMGNVTVFLWRHPIVEEIIRRLPRKRNCKASIVTHKNVPRAAHSLTEEEKSTIVHKRFVVKVRPKDSGNNIFQKLSRETNIAVQPDDRKPSDQSDVEDKVLETFDHLGNEVDDIDLTQVVEGLDKRDLAEVTVNDVIAATEPMGSTERNVAGMMETGTVNSDNDERESVESSRSGTNSRSVSRSSSSSRSSSRSGSRASSRPRSRKSSRSGSRSSSSSRSVSRSLSRSRLGSGSRSRSASSSRSGSRSGSGSRASSKSGSTSRSRSRSGSRSASSSRSETESRSSSRSRSRSRSGSRSSSGSRSRSGTRSRSCSRARSRSVSQSSSRSGSNQERNHLEKDDNPEGEASSAVMEAHDTIKESDVNITEVTSDVKSSQETEENKAQEVAEIDVGKDIVKQAEKEKQKENQGGETQGEINEGKKHPEKSNNSSENGIESPDEEKLEGFEVEASENTEVGMSLEYSSGSEQEEGTDSVNRKESASSTGIQGEIRKQDTFMNLQKTEETKEQELDTEGRTSRCSEQEVLEKVSGRKKETTPEPTLEDDIRDAEMSLEETNSQGGEDISDAQPQPEEAMGEPEERSSRAGDGEVGDRNVKDLSDDEFDDDGSDEESDEEDTSSLQPGISEHDNQSTTPCRTMRGTSITGFIQLTKEEATKAFYEELTSEQRRCVYMELERNVRIQKKVGEPYTHEEKSAIKTELIGKYLKKQREDPESTPGEVLTNTEKKELKRLRKEERKKHKKKKHKKEKHERRKREQSGSDNHSPVPTRSPRELPAQYADLPAQYAEPTLDEILEANLSDTSSGRSRKYRSRESSDRYETEPHRSKDSFREKDGRDYDGRQYRSRDYEDRQWNQRDSAWDARGYTGGSGGSRGYRNRDHHDRRGSPNQSAKNYGHSRNHDDYYGHNRGSYQGSRSQQRW